jgi:hypothetical protein
VSVSKWSVGHSIIEECVIAGGSRLGRGYLDSGMTMLERSVLYDESPHAVDLFDIKIHITLHV